MVRCQIDRHAAGQHPRAALRGEVMRHVGVTRTLAELGRRVDDATAPGGAHVPPDHLPTEVLAGQVDPEDALPFLLWQVEKVMPGADPRVAVKNMDPAELLQAGFEHRFHRGSLSYVDLNRDRQTAGLAYPSGCALGCVSVDVRCHYY